MQEDCCHGNFENLMNFRIYTDYLEIKPISILVLQRAYLGLVYTASGRFFDRFQCIQA